MNALSSKLRQANSDRVLFWCPGCKLAHGITIGSGLGAKWVWNSNPDKPTFRPSILTQRDYGEDHQKQVCHLFVTDGQIKFLVDCTHELAGQTVELPDWPYTLINQ